VHFPGASALGHAALFQKKAVVAREADEDQELNGEGTHARAMTGCMESSSALSGRSGCAHFIKSPASTIGRWSGEGEGKKDQWSTRKDRV
jgi:hypothetical protein